MALGVFLADLNRFEDDLVYTKIAGYLLWLFHFLLFIFTQSRTYILVKNKDCTLLYRTSTDNPLYKNAIEKSLDLKYSLCQICLEKGKINIRKMHHVRVRAHLLMRHVLVQQQKPRLREKVHVLQNGEF